MAYIGIALYVFCIVGIPFIFPYVLVRYFTKDEGKLLLIGLGLITVFLARPTIHSPNLNAVLFLARFLLIGYPFAFKHIYDREKDKFNGLSYVYIGICNVILLLSLMTIVG